MQRKCLTPGAWFNTEIRDNEIIIRIVTPGQVWDGEMAKVIDDRIHDGLEYALGPYWDKEAATRHLVRVKTKHMFTMEQICNSLEITEEKYLEYVKGMY